MTPRRRGSHLSILCVSISTGRGAGSWSTPNRSRHASDDRAEGARTPLRRRRRRDAGLGPEEILVCVSDHRDGAYFEIPAEPHLALDVYYHPFAYRDFSTVDYEDIRLAA